MAAKDEEMAIDQETIKTISDIASDLKFALKEIDEIKKTSAENSRALRGANGNPGMISKMDSQKGAIDSLAKSVETLSLSLSSLDDTICGSKDKQGLITRVEALEKIVDNFKKYAAAIITFIVLDILTRLLPGIYNAMASGLQ